jgi:3-deoxy-D-manno-octulosonic-acid transferase
MSAANDNADTTPVTLRMYRGISAALGPLSPLLLNYRLRRGKEDAARLPERFGETRIPRPRGPLVWVHGASVGEFNTVLPLIEHIRKQAISVLVTTGTVTAAKLARDRLHPQVVHQFVPLDAPRFVGRFLDHWRPDLGMFVESDLWPNMIMETSERGVPLILVNGRLSERSFDRWRLAPGTIAGLLGRFSLCLVRTPVDADRYGSLGAPRLVTTGNLKLDVPAPSADPAALAALTDAIAGRPLLAAASTHPGEDDVIVEAHKLLRQSFSNLLTVIAPRHPERGGDITALAATAGLRATRRSSGALPDATTDIYVADTLGELGLLDRLAPVVFMGGSLIPHGGQNPIEAIKLGAAILHGPHVGNFADIYASLDKARGAARVTDAGKLALRAGAWLGDPVERRSVATAGERAIAVLGGALERTAAALDPYLLQLRQEYRNADA